MAKKAKKKTVKKKKISKKKVKKKTIKKTTPKPKVSTQSVEIKMQPILVDNFIALQKVMINLANKLDDVSTKMEKLLDLFETSAKTLAKKEFKLAGETNPEVIKKLGELSEQNKIIARGLTLLHETAAPAPTPTPIPVPVPTSAPLPAPIKPTGPKLPPTGKPEEEYKKSTPFKPLKPSK